jgi:hypothetical protein
MDVPTVAVGAAGVIVAVAGFASNSLSIRREERDRKQQIREEKERQWSAQRPVVYPLADPRWTEGTGPYEYDRSRRIPLKNGGRGPALNVEGEVHGLAPGEIPYECRIVAGTIGVGEQLDGRIVPPPGVQYWDGAAGTLHYVDLRGVSYASRFRCAYQQGELFVYSEHEHELEQ